MDDFQDSLGFVSKSVEFLNLPILAGFVVGMYRGIEIGHPGSKPSLLRIILHIKTGCLIPLPIL